ncbi:hypothetical protein SOV_04570 [Sporomusa ovata DSM 2662]|uniref:Uncharacterized protein n=1 Tax=Sporomusa ovata TaxID=2378 RepID=A0A0U1KXL2_9FIRM|nr:hypothetical protein [Sporomusa ovata]EQB28127.1 hypothetical protein SOV_2c10500 [Sporomusa ovata DSM 2662]CQR71663.1 hypothetical protein SpAn4DRAFT_3529 [Sporomusa ovata]
MNNLVTTPVVCQACHELMEYDNFGFWKCPTCSGEFWPPEKPWKLQPLAIGEQYVSRSYRGGAKGGSRSSKKHGAKKTEKKSLNQLYHEL